MNMNVNVNGRVLSLASLSYAHSLFKLIPSSTGTSSTRSPFHFNLLIRALSLPSSSSSSSDLDLSLRYFSLLLRYSQPDSYTFPFLFSAYSTNASSSSSSLRARASSEAAHSLALKLGFLPRHHHTAHSLITMYSSFNYHSSARKVFDQIPPNDKDVVSRNSIISAYVNMALSRHAIRLFNHMLSQGFRPNHVTLLPLLSACAHLGDLKTGKWLEKYIHTTNMLQGSFLCSALIGMYAKCGALDHSRRVFDSVPHTRKDNFIWNSMITGYAQNGMANEAIALFHVVRQSNVNPDKITLVGVLSACASIGALNLGKQLDHYPFNKGLYANVFVGTALIDMYFIEQMGNKADAVVLGALLSACRKRRCLEVGEKVMERLLEMEPINSWNYVVSSRLYERSNRMDDSARMRGLMRDRGVTKTPGCSWIETCG